MHIYMYIIIYIYILAENPPYGRAFQLAPAEGIMRPSAPLSLGPFGPKTYLYFSSTKLNNTAALGQCISYSVCKKGVLLESFFTLFVKNSIIALFDKKIKGSLFDKKISNCFV